MRVGTWNVNSIRARLERVLAWLKNECIDVAALQETKVRTGDFPVDAFRDAGYYSEAHGLRGFEGVAIVSRFPIRRVTVNIPRAPGFLSDRWGTDIPQEARAISATTGGIRLYSLYVPNGREVGSPHFEYKLAWLKALASHVRTVLRRTPGIPLMLVGDFNIVTCEQDTTDPDFQLPNDITCSGPEREAFQAILDTGMFDLIRPFAPIGFTSWSYQRQRFQNNQGLRIDFMLGSDSVQRRTIWGEIDRVQRRHLFGLTPSDHAPLVSVIDPPRRIFRRDD